MTRGWRPLRNTWLQAWALWLAMGTAALPASDARAQTDERETVKALLKPLQKAWGEEEQRCREQSFPSSGKPAPNPQAVTSRARKHLMLIRRTLTALRDQRISDAQSLIGVETVIRSLTRATSCTLKFAGLTGSAVAKAVEQASVQSQERNKQAYGQMMASKLAPIARQSTEFQQQLPGLVQRHAAQRQAQEAQGSPMHGLVKGIAEAYAPRAQVPDAGEDVKRLDARAAAAHERGDLASEIELRKTALALREKQMDPAQNELVGRRRHLATLLTDQDPEEALALLTASVRALESAPNNVETAFARPARLQAAVTARMDLEYALGRTEAAKASARRALELASQPSSMSEYAGALAKLNPKMAGASAGTQMQAEYGLVAARRILGEPYRGELTNVFMLPSEAIMALEAKAYDRAHELVRQGLASIRRALNAYQPMGGTGVVFSVASLPLMFEGTAISLAEATKRPEDANLALVASGERQGRAFDVVANATREIPRGKARAALQVRAARSARVRRYLRALAEGTAKPSDHKDVLEEERAHQEAEMKAYMPSDDVMERLVLSGMSTIGGSARTSLPKMAVDDIIDKLHGRLGAHDALVVYTKAAPQIPAPGNPTPQTGEPQYYAMVLTHGAQTRLTNIASAAHVDRLVAQMSADLHAGSAEALAASQRELGQILLEPLASSVGEVERLYLVPDGSLNSVPFDLLQLRGELAIDRFEINYLSSPRELLAHSRPAAGAAVSVVTVDASRPGDPTLGGLLEKPLPALGGAAREAEMVTAMFPAAQQVHLAGAQATEQRFLSLSSPSVLHFAGHGVFIQRGLAGGVGGSRGLSGGGSLESSTSSSTRAQSLDRRLMHTGLVVSPPDSASEIFDGFISAYEVARMPLKGTELVVLSACDTAVGEAFNDQGVASLRRAFAMAGAASVVASLWPVDDAATLKLMQEFYTELKAGTPRGAALRSAKQRTRALHPHPKLWAAFTLSGATESLPITATARSGR